MANRFLLKTGFKTFNWVEGPGGVRKQPPEYGYDFED